MHFSKKHKGIDYVDVFQGKKSYNRLNFKISESGS